MGRWYEKQHRICHLAALIGGWMLLLAAIAVASEVILRKVFTISVGGANELSGYAFAVGGSWAAAYALMERANIRIDAIYRMMHRRVRSLIDLFALSCLIGFVTFLSWRAYLVLSETILLGARSNTPLGTPLWIPQSLWLIGMIVLIVVGLYLLLRAARAFTRGDDQQVAELIGTVGIESELEAEMKDAAARLGKET